MNPTVSTITHSEETAVNPAEAQGYLAQLESLDPPTDLIEPQLTQNAVTVLERRYLKKHPETAAVIETPAQLFWRVATHIAKGELTFSGGTAERALTIAREFYNLMAFRQFMPNSPSDSIAWHSYANRSSVVVL